MPLRPKLLSALVLLSLVTPGCAATIHAPGSAASIADDEQVIRAQRSRWLQAVADKDASGMIRFYEDSAVALYSGSERITGKQAILAEWTQLFDQASLSVISQDVEVSKSGDVAFETAAYQIWIPGAQVTTLDKGKELVIWHKSDGAWRISQEAVITDFTPTPGVTGPRWRQRTPLRLASIAR